MMPTRWTKLVTSKGGYQKEHICKNIDDTYHQSCIYRYWTVHNTDKSDTVNNDGISWHRSISANYKGMIKIYPLVYERVYFFCQILATYFFNIHLMNQKNPLRFLHHFHIYHQADNRLYCQEHHYVRVLCGVEPNFLSEIVIWLLPSFLSSHFHV